MKNQETGRQTEERTTCFWRSTEGHEWSFKDNNDVTNIREKLESLKENDENKRDAAAPSAGGIMLTIRGSDDDDETAWRKTKEKERWHEEDGEA